MNKITIKKAAPIAIAAVLLTGLAFGSGTDEKSSEGTSADKQTTQTADKPKKSACIKIHEDTLDAIAEGLTKKAEITRGFAVKLPSPEANLRYITALEIKDATGTATAMLAMGGLENGGGPWVIADNYAELYLNWGSEAKDGSPLRNAAKNAWLSEEGTAATDCL